MATFEIVLVARIPQELTAPTLVEVDRLVVDTISYTHELNRPGSARFGCPIASLSDTAKERLSNLATFPSEVWVYRDSTLAWSGEIQTVSIESQTVQLSCAGLLGYTFRMGITSDLTFTGVDQFTIAKSLVDHWQNQTYGNYGIDTSSISTSGVLRDRTYLRDELNNIGQRLQELGAVIDGFDMHVDPTTRDLVLSYPERGTDLTASVFFDRLNIDSASVAMSVGPDDLVSDVSGTGTVEDTGGSNTKLYTVRSNVAVRTAYGRSWNGQNFDGVTNLSTLEGHLDAYKDVRDDEMFQPGVTLIPRDGADSDDFGPGDTVSYSYDAGLGLQSGSYRVAKVTVNVDQDGKQRLAVEFV